MVLQYALVFFNKNDDDMIVAVIMTNVSYLNIVRIFIYNKGRKRKYRKSAIRSQGKGNGQKKKRVCFILFMCVCVWGEILSNK